jgi:hypothetical protein
MPPIPTDAMAEPIPPPAPTAAYLPLDGYAAEVIVAPFHDPLIAPSLGAQLAADPGSNAALEFCWCWTHIVWSRAGAEMRVACLRVPLAVELGRFNHLTVAVAVPESASLVIHARVDGQSIAGQRQRGSGRRGEYHLDVAGERLQEVRLEFFAHSAEPAIVILSWIAVADTVMLQAMSRGGLRYGDDWAGLIKPMAEWTEPKFALGLLFDESHLRTLRRRRTNPAWQSHFALLEARARRAMQRRPESELADFLPWSDIRYLRASEQGREPYYWDAQLLALVGLINQDPAMIRHALRFLMCIIHTPNWCQSAESRLRGSTWDQRCFLEEMATTTVALLSDWLDAALTDRARELIAHTMWDQGLAIIERDCMKEEYLHHMNQGPWFCRARVLGGLLLERRWPRVGDYVERAMADLRESLASYILPDGGSDEGIGYWSLTIHSVLPALIAYARSRGIDARSLLPDAFAQCGNFLATMSAVVPGKVLLDGDNSTDGLIGDTIPILAAMDPQSLFARIAAAALLEQRPPTFFNQYVLDGLLGFALGPEQFQAPRTIVPTFSRLQHIGQLTSFRTDGARSLRLHVTGCKAKPSHSHRDKGGFTLEVDGVAMLIDRGIVRYDDPRCELMHLSSLHNVLTPVREDGTFPDQALAATPVIPQGAGDATRVNAQVDLGPVWLEWMTECRRTFRSGTLDQLTIEDRATLHQPGRLAFHLQAPAPFHIRGATATLAHENKRLQIHLPWAHELMMREELIDFAFRPAWRLTALSPPGQSFDLQTLIRRIDP